MMLGLPEQENLQKPKLKYGVTTTAKFYTNRLTAYLTNKGFETFRIKLINNNELLSNLPEHSPAHVPKTTTIPKNNNINIVTPEQETGGEEPKTKTYSKRDKGKRKYLFQPTDNLLMTINRIAKPRSLEEFDQWLTELESMQNIPESWTKTVKDYLPNEFIMTAKTVVASQTNLRDNKNWVIQKTGGNKTGIQEVTFHAPLELMENLYKFTELNLIRGAELDENALIEFKKKTGLNINTETMQNLGNNTNLAHIGIIGLRLESTEKTPVILTKGDEDEKSSTEKLTDEEEEDADDEDADDEDSSDSEEQRKRKKRRK